MERLHELSELKNAVIDWEMTPEDAVTLYLEWGNNSWRGKHPPVRPKNAYATYFVVDTWDGEPRLRLIRRNSEEAVELADIELPEDMRREFIRENGHAKGVYAITDEIRHWLESKIYQ